MDWNQSDSVRLREYLNTSNRAVIAALKAMTPKVVVDTKSKMEAVALLGARKEGFEEAISLLVTLSEVTQKQETPEAGNFTTM